MRDAYEASSDDEYVRPDPELRTKVLKTFLDGFGDLLQLGTEITIRDYFKHVDRESLNPRQRKALQQFGNMQVFELVYEATLEDEDEPHDTALKELSTVKRSPFNCLNTLWTLCSDSWDAVDTPNGERDTEPQIDDSVNAI